MLKKIKVQGVYYNLIDEIQYSKCVYLGKNGRLYAKFPLDGWMHKGLGCSCWGPMRMSKLEYILFRLGGYHVL